MRHAGRFVISFCLIALLLTGCNKLSDSQKTQLATASAAAKDRAVSFGAISAGLAPVDANDGEAVARWIVSHQNGLNAEALALSNLVAAVQTGDALKQQTRDELSAAMTTAQMRVSTFKAMRPKLKLTDSQSVWADAHAIALQKLADDLTLVVNSFARPAPNVPTKPTPAPPVPAASK